MDTTDGTTLTITAGAIASGVYGPGTISATQDDPGESFEAFSTAFTQGDALVTTAPSVGAVGALSNQLSTGGWNRGNLEQDCDFARCSDRNCGGAGTVATGQFVSELLID